ncbi:hypothetical protein C8J56DRAFT_1037261 [Mycena floridula]|nr:hypothetical protein C8J56DRAFT_1037261 [Mycena floridula]
MARDRVKRLGDARRDKAQLGSHNPWFGIQSNPIHSHAIHLPPSVDAGIQIHNMNPPENVAAISKKQKSGGAHSDKTDLCTAELTKKYRTLGAHLWCKHNKDHCYMKANGDHDNQHQSLWAQEWTHGCAILECPPENIVFQHYFIHKRQRRSNKSMMAQPSMPAVNVYVNTGPGQSSQSHQNLPDEAGTKTTPIEIVELPSPSEGYPLVADILHHMDNLPDFRNLEIPPSTFATYLEHEWELTTVKQAAIVHRDTFIDGASMTLALANTFIALSQKAVFLYFFTNNLNDGTIRLHSLE